jgi:hypothetical protein
MQHLPQKLGHGDACLLSGKLEVFSQFRVGVDAVHRGGLKAAMMDCSVELSRYKCLSTVCRMSARMLCVRSSAACRLSQGCDDRLRQFSALLGQLCLLASPSDVVLRIPAGEQRWICSGLGTYHPMALLKYHPGMLPSRCLRCGTRPGMPSSSWVMVSTRPEGAPAARRTYWRAAPAPRSTARQPRA